MAIKVEDVHVNDIIRKSVHFLASKTILELYMNQELPKK